MKPSKRPSKEDFVLTEREKVENEVFDKETLKVLSRIIKKGLVSSVDYPISTGKEANVFRATTPSGEFIIVKVYKIDTSPFFRREEYLTGDPRFAKIKHNNKDIVFTFAKKEFKNLQICENAGVNAPRPIYMEKNVLLMSFLGVDGLPYPTLNQVGPRSEKDLESVLKDIKKMYCAGLVHTDLSEYNLLLGDFPYLIDFGQGVITSTPNADKFLQRDVLNVLNYFRKAGYIRDFEKTLAFIKNKK
ncbi:MAG: serine protein kinase RIO [Candidatus Micrarchaeota archaeon]